MQQEEVLGLGAGVLAQWARLWLVNSAKRFPTEDGGSRHPSSEPWKPGCCQALSDTGKQQAVSTRHWPIFPHRLHACLHASSSPGLLGNKGAMLMPCERRLAQPRHPQSLGPCLHLADYIPWHHLETSHCNPALALPPDLCQVCRLATSVHLPFLRKGTGWGTGPSQHIF